MALRIGLDTNILLRFAYSGHPESALIAAAVRRLREMDSEFCFTPQNIGEFWNVSTRPADQNGFGLSPRSTLTLVTFIEQSMTLLPDDLRVYANWRNLLIDHNIQGVQVHDAHLAASLEAHGVSHLLTMNVADFSRFTRLTTMHPKDV